MSEFKQKNGALKIESKFRKQNKMQPSRDDVPVREVQCRR